MLGTLEEDPRVKAPVTRASRPSTASSTRMSSTRCSTQAAARVDSLSLLRRGCSIS
jgi:hypothetical protein